MRCLNSRKLELFFDEALNEERAKAIENHLNSCSKCFRKAKRTRQRLKLIDSALESADPERIPAPDLTGAIKMTSSPR